MLKHADDPLETNATASTRFTWNTEDTFDNALTPAPLLCIMERAPRTITSAKREDSAYVDKDPRMSLSRTALPILETKSLG